MRSQAGPAGGSLSGTQQRTPTLPGSSTQKGFNKTAKGTTKPMGATLPVSACIALHLHGTHSIPSVALDMDSSVLACLSVRAVNTPMHSCMDGNYCAKPKL